MHLEDINGVPKLPGIEHMGSPLAYIKETYDHISELCDILTETSMTGELCRNENPHLMQQRWTRLKSNLYNEKRGTFDTTKIPDIFDYITYDTIHNQKVIDYDMHPLFHKAEIMADFIVPAEYGIEPDDKFLIGSLISEALIQKIFRDVVSISHGNSQSKTHLYFTSESHLHTLRNILLHSGVAKFHQLDEPVELHYLTHLVFKLYENLLAPPESSDRWMLEVLFSSGAHKNPFRCITQDHYQTITPMITIHNHMSLEELQRIVVKTNAAKIAAIGEAEKQPQVELYGTP